VRVHRNRVANSILWGLVAFPGRNILFPGTAHEDPIRQATRSCQGTILAACAADHARCGLSVRAYCQREGLQPWNFHWWRQELARRDAEVVSARSGRCANSFLEPARGSAFLPVRVVPDADSIAMTTSIEILMPAGPTVRVTHGFDPHALDAVLSILEARRC
jgi:transposase